MTPFNKKGHILELKKALKINFSVFPDAVRSLVAPTVHIGRISGNDNAYIDT